MNRGVRVIGWMEKDGPGGHRTASEGKDAPGGERWPWRAGSGGLRVEGDGPGGLRWPWRAAGQEAFRPWKDDPGGFDDLGG